MRSFTSAPAVATSSANSSSPASVSARVSWARVTPTSTMRSRTVREMRVSVKAESFGVTIRAAAQDLLAVHVDLRHLPDRSLQPHRAGHQATPGASHPDCARRPSPRPVPNCVPRPRRRRSRCRRPGSRPRPRSHTRRVMASAPGPTEMNSTLIPSGMHLLEPGFPARRCPHRPGRGRGGPDGDCPCRPGGPGGRRTAGAGRGRGPPRPCPPRPPPSRAPRPAGSRRSAVRPASDTVNVGGFTRPRLDRGLGQAPDAVPAHLGDAPVGVAELHGQIGPALVAMDPDDPVGAEPEPPVAQGPDELRLERRGAVDVHQHQEVVAGPVVLGQVERSGRSVSADSWCCRTVSHPGTVSGNLPEEGGNRCHRVGIRLQPHDTGIAAEPCHLPPGKGTGAADGPVDGFVDGHAALDVGEQLPVAEGLAGRPRQAPGPGGQRADLLRGSRAPSDGRTARRCAGRGRPGRDGSRPTRPGSAGSARVPGRRSRRGGRHPR